MRTTESRRKYDIRYLGLINIDGGVRANFEVFTDGQRDTYAILTTKKSIREELGDDEIGKAMSVIESHLMASYKTSWL